MLYLHISHVLCLQLPSICTRFIALLIPLCTYTYLLYHEHHLSLDFYNVRLAENTYSVNRREHGRRDVVFSFEENRLRGTAEAWTSRTSTVMTQASSKAISMN